MLDGICVLTLQNRPGEANFTILIAIGVQPFKKNPQDTCATATAGLSGITVARLATEAVLSYAQSCALATGRLDTGGEIEAAYRAPVPGQESAGIIADASAIAELRRQAGSEQIVLDLDASVKRQALSSLD
jgi:hypothetical protein